MSLQTLLLSALATTTTALPALLPRQTTSTSNTFYLTTTVTSSYDLTPSLNGLQLYGNDTFLTGGFGATGFGHIVFSSSGSGFYTKSSTAGIAWFAVSTATTQAPMSVGSGQVANVTTAGTGTEGIAVSDDGTGTYKLTNAAGGKWLGCPASMFGFEGGQAEFVVLSWRGDEESTAEGCAEVEFTPVCNTVLAAPSGSVSVSCAVVSE